MNCPIVCSFIWGWILMAVCFGGVGWNDGGAGGSWKVKMEFCAGLPIVVVLFPAGTKQWVDGCFFTDNTIKKTKKTKTWSGFSCTHVFLLLKSINLKLVSLHFNLIEFVISHLNWQAIESKQEMFPFMDPELHWDLSFELTVQSLRGFLLLNDLK